MNRSTLAASLMILATSLLQACGGGGGGSFQSPDDGSPDPAPSSEPELKSAQADLDAALNCTPFTHPDKPPVLLVHGTGATGTEEYTLFYTPQLVALGYDVCIVTYPDRGLGDLQVSAEYIVNALRSINADTGRKVAMIGHSQGATMPRWALKFWPSARDATADFVMLAGPNHGTTVAVPTGVLTALFDTLGLGDIPVGLLPEALYQFTPTANFITVLNTGDETPGDVDYTSIYTRFDSLVQPVNPVPTAALEFGLANAKISNVLLQDVCPGHISGHIPIGTTDPLAFALAVDAISHSGPADFERAGGSNLCNLLPIDPSTLLMTPIVTGLLTITASTLQNGIPQPHLAQAEPPLMDYALAP